MRAPEQSGPFRSIPIDLCGNKLHSGAIGPHRAPRNRTHMAVIQPLTGLRYNRRDVSDVLAPPYDILSAAEKKALLEKDDHNIVAIDLPHIPPKSAGPDRVYNRAAGDLTCWLDIRTLAHDERPALYAYHQTYKLAEKTLTRRMFFARLQLEPLGRGRVFAHEETFGGPKEDRLKLTAATRCNLSPIFALYPDADNEVSGLIDQAISPEPDQWGMLDGVENKLWVIDDLPTIKSIQARLVDKPVFIADGHHRYGTALMYRQQQVDQTGEPMADDPVSFVLAVLGGMEDPGATIQPYFRTICKPAKLTAGDLQSALSEAFDWRPAEMPGDAAALARRLAESGSQAIGLYLSKDGAFVTIVPRKEDLLAGLEPKRNPAWRRLPYAILHRFIIDEVLRKRFPTDGEPEVHYHKTMKEAVEDARKSSGLAALMPATTMQELRDVCTAGELMPQKSTYFYPKLATGLVINPLY